MSGENKIIKSTDFSLNISLTFGHKINVDFSQDFNELIQQSILNEQINLANIIFPDTNMNQQPPTNASTNHRCTKMPTKY